MCRSRVSIPSSDKSGKVIDIGRSFLSINILTLICGTHVKGCEFNPIVFQSFYWETKVWVEGFRHCLVKFERKRSERLETLCPVETEVSIALYTRRPLKGMTRERAVSQQNNAGVGPTLARSSVFRSGFVGIFLSRLHGGVGWGVHGISCVRFQKLQASGIIQDSD